MPEREKSRVALAERGAAQKQGKLTRRDFLKTTALLAGTATLAGMTSNLLVGCDGGASTRLSEVEEQVFACTCAGNCHGKACMMDVVVREGKAVNINKFFGDSPHETLCPKGYMNIERMYSPTRVKYPMKQTGERGSEEWEQLSWDDAIREISDRLNELRSAHGDQCVLFLRGVANNLSAVGWYPNRLKAYMGAYDVPFIYDMNGLVTVPKFIGATTGTSFAGLVDAKKIFIWGSNPSESATITFHFITEAQAKGGRVIVIDPIFTTSAAKADRWVPLRPGSDGLLSIGMMKVAIRDGLVDQDFLRTKSQAPFLIKDVDGRVLRLSDVGKAEAGTPEDLPLVRDAEGTIGSLTEIAEPVLEGRFTVEGLKVTTAYSLLQDRLDVWSLEQIASLTEIALETIEELAREYADGPSSIVTGFGIDHYGNGHTGYANMMTMMGVFGQVAKPGASCEIVSCSVPTAAGALPYGMVMPPDAPVNPVVYIPNLYETVVGDSARGIEPTIKAAVVWADNPIANMPERLVQIEAFMAMDIIVVVDIFMSETAKLADYVLPACFIFETQSIAFAGSPYMSIIEQAATPAYESRSDFEIANLLGQALGFVDEFSMTQEEYLAACLDNDLARAFGITWDKLKSEKRILASGDAPLYGPDGFATPSGRLEFYFEDSLPMYDNGEKWDARYEALPYWEPPLEAWPENPLYSEYPLILTSERSKFKTHTMFTHVPSLLEIDGEPSIQVNPEDAAERKVAFGDVVRIHNGRGSCTLKAVINPGIRKGMLVMDHGWEADQFIAGHYNDLPLRRSNRSIPNPNSFDCLCELEKVG
jgi:molybdopterin-containing oxidoreductase family molybdopterin binding subunit